MEIYLAKQGLCPFETIVQAGFLPLRHFLQLCAWMAPWIYDRLCDNIIFVKVATKIAKKINVLKAASCSIMEMIDLLNNCNDPAYINAILDTPEYMQIMNSSQQEAKEKSVGNCIFY